MKSIITSNLLHRRKFWIQMKIIIGIEKWLRKWKTWNCKNTFLWKWRPLDCGSLGNCLLRLCLRPVSHDRVCPLKVSPRRLYFETDSPPETLFRNRFSPRRLYSETKSPGGREYFIPRRNKVSPGETLFQQGRKYSFHPETLFQNTVSGREDSVSK